LTTAIKKNMAKVFFEEMGFIRNWKMVGPFDNNRRDGIIVAKPLTIKNEQLYIGNKIVKAQDYLSPEGFIDFHDVFKKKIMPEKVYYAYALTTVSSATTQSVQLRTASFFPFKIWLNGRVVYNYIKPSADCPDKRRINVKLKAGNNRIVVMVTQTTVSPFARWGFWLRIADGKGKIIDFKKAAKSHEETQNELKIALRQVESGKLKNLIPNPSFEGLSSFAATTLRITPSSIKSKVSLDTTKAYSGKTSLKLINIKRGSAFYTLMVKPGEKYLVGFDCFNNGNSIVCMKIAWQGRGKSPKQIFHESAKGKWEKIVGIVTVPPNATQMLYCIAIYKQGAKDSCFVDNLMLYKLK